ncbi:MAG: flagellar biosynthesis protein FlgI [Methylococcaceae bacterium TMED69]|nr:MAG: flagellar biosynthesis protein FlgI [Methylococcaceae bacterium TMED69]
MKNNYLKNASLGLLLILISKAVMSDRIKDLADVAGVRSNHLVGYGIVVGLAGTGDGTDLPIAGQSLKTMLSGLGVSVDGPVSDYDLRTEIANDIKQNVKKDLEVKNAAAVMITAEVPPFAKPGQKFDVNVSAIGKAESLRGGSLLLAPLKGVDGRTYALAQGGLTVMAAGAAAAGTSVQIGVATSGRIPNGAILERMIETPFDKSEHVVLNVKDGDFSTANALTAKINETFGPGVASAVDGVSVAVKAPTDLTQRVSFMSMIENLDVEPGEPPARVVINSRTGTAVINRSVRVTAAAVTHGTISVRIQATNEVSQAGALAQGGQTQAVQNVDISVDEPDSKMFLFEPGIELQDIVDAVNQVGATPSSLIAILEALRRSGSLRAELVVI